MIGHHQEKTPAIHPVPRREGTDAVPERPIRRGHKFDRDLAPRRHVREVRSHRLGLRPEHDHEAVHASAHARQQDAFAQRQPEYLCCGLRRAVLEGRESEALSGREDNAARHGPGRAVSS